MRDLGKELLPSPAPARGRQIPGCPRLWAQLLVSKTANYERFGEIPGPEAASNYEKFGQGAAYCIRKYEGFGESPLPCPFGPHGHVNNKRRGDVVMAPARG
jgi:hypothetical protein